MLDKVKLALSLSTTTFDTELAELITAAVLDLKIAEVNSTAVVSEPTDSLVSRAITSYCVYHFELEHGDQAKAERFKTAYDEQKAQLSMATGYTVWNAPSN